MLAPLATLAFLAALWLIAVLLAQAVTDSRSKMLAALRGHSQLAATPTVVPVAARVSQRSRQRPMRAQPRWRAAA